MDKGKMVTVGVLAAAGVAGLYILTKSGVLSQGLMGTQAEPGWMNPDTGAYESPTIYQFPAEPSVNFPQLPPYQEIFPQPSVQDILGTGDLKKPFVTAASAPSPKVSTSSSNVLGSVNEIAGGAAWMGLLSTLFGPAGTVIGGIGVVAKKTPLGDAVGNVLSGLSGSAKKESTITSNMGGFGATGVTTVSTGAGRGASSGSFSKSSFLSSISSSIKKTTTTSKTSSSGGSAYGGSSDSGYGGGGAGGR